MTVRHLGFTGVDVDLRFDPSRETWTGHFHRSEIDREVLLTRPGPGPGVARGPLVGTWSRPGLGNNCLHVTQSKDGATVAWSDDLITPGRIQYANGIRPPEWTLEYFGSPAAVSSSEGAVLIELKTLSAGCCPISSGGRLSMRRGMLDIRATRGSSGDVPWGDWQRVRGDSCLAALALSESKAASRRSKLPCPKP